MEALKAGVKIASSSLVFRSNSTKSLVIRLVFFVVTGWKPKSELVCKHDLHLPVVERAVRFGTPFEALNLQFLSVNGAGVVKIIQIVGELGGEEKAIQGHPDSGAPNKAGHGVTIHFRNFLSNTFTGIVIFE